MFYVKTLVHPTDFSESSRQAFELACDLASQHEAKLILVHALTLPVPPPMPYGDAGVGATANDESEAWDLLLQMEAAHPSLQIECVLAEGMPAKEILRVASETNADFIVMGTHGRTGLRRLLMGSVAEHVVRSAPCRVITVRGQVPEVLEIIPNEAVAP